MTGYITKESRQELFYKADASFFATVVELDPELHKRMLAFEDKVRTFRTYLEKLDAQVGGRTNVDLSTVEVPECLEAESVEPPKQQASARRSSKKSQPKRKGKGSGSSTSQKAAE